MGSLSEIKLGSVRRMIQAASDRAIRDLEAALSAGAERHDGMRMIQRMVVAEAQDRRASSLTFAPVSAVCRPRPESPSSVVFPHAVLSHLWRGLRERHPAEVQHIVLAISRQDADPPTADQLNALCVSAASGLRSRSSAAFQTAAELLERVSPTAVDIFADYLELTPVARAAVERLPEWVGRQTDERVAAARLAFRDAGVVCEDGGLKLLDLLYSHLDEPWKVLRLISAVMNRPADGYVANSEFAPVGERLLDEVESRVTGARRFELDGGFEAGQAAGRSVRVAAQEMAEFDTSLDLAHNGPWGSRIARQKKALAEAVDSRLKSLDEVLAHALPVHSSPGSKRSNSGPPNLSHDPDPLQVARAMAMLGFLQEVRSAAERLGCMSLWTRVADEARMRLDAYADELIRNLRHMEEDDDPVRIRKFLEISAQMLAIVADERTAQLVRRRMAVAA